MKNILVIGGGSIGKRHLRNLRTIKQKKISLVETDKKRAIDLKKEFALPVYSSVDEALKNDQFNVAFICTPTAFHLDAALKCAAAGCDLFIEKPVSHNLKETEILSRLVNSKKLITMVGCNMKFHPMFIKMKQLIEENKVGKILSARCQFGQYLPDWHPWEDYRKGYSANKKKGGGILLDAHEFDYMTWFMGDAKKLFCLAKKISDLEIDVEDVAEVVLEFKNGCIGTIHLDYLQRFYQRNFEFFGENGTISWDIYNKCVSLKIKEKNKKKEKKFFIPDNYDYNVMYINEIKHFMSSVDNRKKTISPVDRGLYVLKLISLAKQSATKEKVLKIV